MSYDFVVLAPEFVTTRADVPPLHRAMCAETREPAPALVTLFARRLTQETVFKTAQITEDARGAVISTRWQTMPTSLRSLLEITRDYGLLLYDPQIDRCYDPRGGLLLETVLGDGVEVPYVSEALLAEYVAQPTREAPFLVVKRDGDHYAQAYLHRFKPADVEYRAGGPDEHYAATTDRTRVGEILWSWACGSDGWRTAVDWTRTAV